MGKYQLRPLLQKFRRLSKNCGKLRLEGNELNINDVTSDEFVVQDVFRRNPPLRIGRADPRISELELQPEFT